MIKQVLAEGRCPPWVTGDEVYGRDAKLRAFLEDQHTGYVLKIPCSFRVTLPTGQKIRADHAARLVPAARLADRLGRARVQGRAGLPLGVAGHRLRPPPPAHPPPPRRPR